MRIVAPTVLELGLIALTLCENDQRHFCAMTGTKEYDHDAAARYLAGLSGPVFCLLRDDGRPVGAGGCEPMGMGVFRPWMAITTDGWTKHWRDVTKAARRAMDATFADGARRMETETLAGDAKAIAWYEKSLGMVREGFHPAKYADGSDAVSFGRVR